MTKRLDGRIALITGASRGIGRAIARRFAAEGATIIAMARTQAGLEELDDEIRALGGTCSLVVEDLLDYEKIDHVGAALYQRFGKLDIVVGNAALLGTLTPVTHIKPTEFEKVLNVNLTANWRLLRSLDPLLRQSDAGRAIFLTSSVAQVPRAYWGTYAISKAALEMMVKVYAEEVVTTKIRANLYDPGATRTAMRASAFPSENPESLPPVEVHGDALVDLAAPTCTLNGQVVAHKK